MMISGIIGLVATGLLYYQAERDPIFKLAEVKGQEKALAIEKSYLDSSKTLSSEELKTQQKQIAIRSQEIENNRRLAEMLQREVDAWKVAAERVFFASSTFLLAGMLFWYFKLQRHQDRLIKTKASLAVLRLQESAVRLMEARKKGFDQYE